MSKSTRRTIVRFVHLVLSIPILGYIYSPFEKLPQYAPQVRYVFLPLIVLSRIVDVEGSFGETTAVQGTRLKTSANKARR